MALELEPFRSSQGPWLLCSRKDGVGARLANLLWTWRFARGAGLRTICFWPPLPSYYASNAGAQEVVDLASPRAAELKDELGIVDGRPRDYFRPAFVELDYGKALDPADYAVSASDIAGEETPRARVITSADRPPFREGETPAEVLEDAKRVFARLPLPARIVDAVDSLAGQHDFGRLVAVHVRRGDIVEGLRTACLAFGPDDLLPRSMLDRYTQHYLRGCAPTRTYLAIAKRFVETGHRIMFFSDTPSTASAFQKRFASDLLFAADLAPARLNSVQQALFEIVLMSRCSAIVATVSKFSTLASVIGGAPLLDVRGEATPAHTIRAFRRASGFDELPADVRAGVTEILLRQLQRGRQLRRWKVDADEIRRLLQATR